MLVLVLDLMGKCESGFKLMRYLGNALNDESRFTRFSVLHYDDIIHTNLYYDFSKDYQINLYFSKSYSMG